MKLNLDYTREELMRRAGKRSLYYFAKNVLGYNLLKEIPHKEFCDDLEKLTETLRDPSIVRRDGLKKMKLWPRGILKTTIGAIALPLWLSLHNRNLRVLVHSATLKGLAMKITIAIRDHIESNEKFRRLYGDLQGSGKWTDDEITIKRDILGIKEASFTAGAVGSVQTGPHYDLIISDDPVNEENIGTKEQLTKVIDDHKQLHVLLQAPTDTGSGGVLLLLGTRWHFGDLYGWAEKMPDVWGDIDIRDADEDMNIRSFYPEGYLENQKTVLGTQLYNCWFRNKPRAEEDAEFHEEWFEWWSGDLEDLPKGSRLYAAFDPAICEKEDSDRVGKAVIAWARRGPIQIIEAKELHINPTAFVDEVFDTHKKYRPYGLRTIGIEMVGGFKNLKYWLSEEMIRRDTYLSSIELKPGTSAGAKMARIRDMIPRYENRRIQHTKGMKDLEDQLLYFPLWTHRDIADALAYAIEMGARASSRSFVVTEEEAEEYERNAWIRKRKASRPGELVLPGNFPKREEDWMVL